MMPSNSRILGMALLAKNMYTNGTDSCMDCTPAASSTCRYEESEPAQCVHCSESMYLKSKYGMYYAYQSR